MPSTTNQQHTGLTVKLSKVSRVFPGNVAALDQIDLDVPAGQFLSLVGPSGCGKSTLLRLISKLDQPQFGQINLSSPADPLSPHVTVAASLAFVFQDPQLLPWRNVVQNVALPLELMHAPKAEQRQSALHAIERVGLSDAATRYPSQLSGGMKMRVSLARALVTNPRLLLMDEPFAALDEITRQRLDEQLRQLWLARGMTVLFVTHSLNEALFLSQRVLVMSRRPGRFVADHPVDLPEQRAPALRGDPRFALQVGQLLQILRDQTDDASSTPGPS